MTPRFICPHCHRPIDPQTLEAACGAGVQYRICPDCDGPMIVLTSSAILANASPEPTVTRDPPTLISEGCTR